MQENLTLSGDETGIVEIAGFWRRTIAFFIDGLFLGAIGWLLGLIFSDFFVVLGAWGRLLGFAIAFLYFGVADSALTNGQSLGKRLLKIRLADATGNALSVPMASLRYAVFGVPYFLNGAQIDPTIANSWIVALFLCFVVFGLGLSSLYLLIFNRKTRQSLHDLVVRGFVVSNRGSGVAPHMQVWKGHFIVVGALFILSVLTPSLIKGFVNAAPFEDLVKLQQAIQLQPEVKNAGVWSGSTTTSSASKGTQTTQAISINVALTKEASDYEALANKLASIVLAIHSDASGKDLIQVTISYGYDIGIASAWRNRNYSFSPSQWQVRSRATGVAQKAS